MSEYLSLFKNTSRKPNDLRSLQKTLYLNKHPYILQQAMEHSTLAMTLDNLSGLEMPIFSLEDMPSMGNLLGLTPLL